MSIMFSEGDKPMSIMFSAQEIDDLFRWDRFEMESRPESDGIVVHRASCPPKPKRVIFNPPATIVEWEDGDKTVVKCYKDEFSEEFGFAMAMMRKLYGTRKRFQEQFADAYRPYLNPKRKKSPEKDGYKYEEERAASKLLDSINCGSYHTDAKTYTTNESL